MKILLIEDDTQILEFIANGMREAGNAVDIASCGKTGSLLASSENYDVMIIDRMLPEVDGLTILKTLRSCGNEVPVIILSALGEVDDRIEGLRAGGDDYLVKPFAFAELLARTEVLARRKTQANLPVTVIETGDLRLDLLARRVTRAGKIINLQAREFSLLSYLLKHKGQLVTRTMLLEAVWDYHFDPQTSIIDVHISRLRKKIGDGSSEIIRTVRGAGYIIEDIR